MKDLAKAAKDNSPIMKPSINLKKMLKKQKGC